MVIPIIGVLADARCGPGLFYPAVPRTPLSPYAAALGVRGYWLIGVLTDVQHGATFLRVSRVGEVDCRIVD